MGSLPRLKKKDELHYRKGSTNDTRNCAYCKNVGSVRVINNGVEMRCNVMGIKASVRYRVRPDYTCDAQVYNGK